MLLDAEVSEFDRRLVAAHLARCAGCRSFEVSIREVTEELRTAPLERPSQFIVLPQRRRRIAFGTGRFSERPSQVIVLPPRRRRIAFGTAQFSAAATLLVLLSLVTQSDMSDPQRQSPAAQVDRANLFKTTSSWPPEVEVAQIHDDTGTRGEDGPGPGPLPAL